MGLDIFRSNRLNTLSFAARHGISLLFAMHRGADIILLGDPLPGLSPAQGKYIHDVIALKIQLDCVVVLQPTCPM